MASPVNSEDQPKPAVYEKAASPPWGGASLAAAQGGVPATYQPQSSSVQSGARRRVGMKRGAWAVWWLSALTLGIYYLVWYYKINAELRAFAPEVVDVNPGKATVAQILPIFSWVSLAHTSARLNDAHRAINSPVRVSGGMSILGTFWFNSQTRYLQRRLNSLWDAQDTISAQTHR